MRLFPVDVESSSTAYILFYHRVMPGDNTALRTSSRSPSLAGIEHEVGNILTGLSTEAAAPPAHAVAVLPPDLIPAPLQASQQDTIMREASNPTAAIPPTATTQDADDMQM